MDERDIEKVIARVKGILPNVQVKQLHKRLPTDDDGIWWFSLPDIPNSIQLESSSGYLPFLVETDEQSSEDARSAYTIAQAKDLVVEFLIAQQGLRSFMPVGATVLMTKKNVIATLEQHRAIVYITVTWSGQERLSRRVFADFVKRINVEHPELEIRLSVLSEHSPGVTDWFKVLQEPTTLSTGKGAIAWLSGGTLLGTVESLGEFGIKQLIERTLAFWSSPPQAVEAL